MLAVLQANNARFAKEWAEIQTNPAYTEYLIRKNLGYLKKDEMEYRVAKQ